MNFVYRRRNLGATSCRAIVALSTTGLQTFRDDPPPGGIVFRWGCTGHVQADSIVNPASAIHAVSDKAGFRRTLNEHHLCPPTWFSPDSLNATEAVPLIVRPRTHHQGRNLFVCSSQAELAAAWRRVGNGYISTFIDKVAEYRVFVVSGKVVCVAAKVPPKDGRVAWNVAQGGQFVNVRWANWPMTAIRAALAAFNLSGLDFGGVDVMVDASDHAHVLEINSAPSLTSPYRQACMTKAFDWVVLNGKGHLPDANRRGYGRFIHPAVEAQS